MSSIEQVALHEATRRRYLNYALSVITSRALPDIRDGLKPVQRRILYAMFHNLRLLPGSRYRKSAAVVGEVMAKYHPHGDQAIYDAMVRMAQSFSLRLPLVDGHGNFGSVDGDPAAAMRYTECRLTPVAMELLTELAQRTVDYRPTYDGQLLEPTVLPARFPQLLVNGTEGIAVGMATRIPPHNPGEVLEATIALIDDPAASTQKLAGLVKAPDFPTGGVILNNAQELLELYEKGAGAVRVRGEWVREKRGRKHLIVVTSIPFGQNKAALVEKIGALVSARRLPQLTDVRDESTDEVRVVLELKRPGDAEAAMAYLFKHTPLQQSYHVNLTVLVPSENPEVARPARLNLRALLKGWLDFRFQAVRRRFEFELRRLRERIHILEGLEAIFVDLDEAIAIIRRSEGRREAGEKLMEHFDLDDIQADAILELKLYRLSRLEVMEIRQELAERRQKAGEIEAILSRDSRIWSVIRDELAAIRKKYAQPRRTRLANGRLPELAYRDEAYIVAEDAFVIVTRDGWIKRQSSFSDIEKIRTREGDTIAWLFRASTRSTVGFFTDRGSAYVMRVDDIPATTGHGGPVQRHFQFADGERTVGVMSFDPRNTPLDLPPHLSESVPGPGVNGDYDEPPPPHGMAVTAAGRVVRFPLAPHAEVSSRLGRRFQKLGDPSDAVVAVYAWPGLPGSEGSKIFVCLGTRGGRALAFPVEQVKVLRGAGKGLMAIKLRPGDRVMAFGLASRANGGPLVKTSRGRELRISPGRFAGNRAGRGAVVLKRGEFVEWIPEPLQPPHGNGRGEKKSGDGGEE